MKQNPINVCIRNDAIPDYATHRPIRQNYAQ